MTQTTNNNNKGHILVVDDSPINLRLIVDLFKARGYSVRPIPSGKLAITAIQNLPPDLILLDIMMPEMDGYEVCEKLKADPQTKDIPIIFVSALDEVLDKVKAFEMGGVDYVSKPIQEKELFARVETHLQISRLQQHLEEKNNKLATAYRHLKQAQNQLVQSEKMAALGQLIAGISHEINTPLGAIRSSVENLTYFLERDIEIILNFWQTISPDNQPYFLELLRYPSFQGLSSREKRQLKKELRNTLDTNKIKQSDRIADTLVDLGISEDKLAPILPLFQQPDGLEIMDKAYQFFSLRKSTETIQTATERAAKIVFALKSYARYDLGTQKMEGDLINGIETVLTLYHNQIKKGVEVIKNYIQLPPIFCYADELTQVWTNLIHNALQAMDYQGTLKIDVQQENGMILVKITDSGKGIPDNILPRIFEPFFTTKIAGEGSGLGLDIVKRIVEKHDGKIKVFSIPGKTTFTVSIPIITQEESSNKVSKESEIKELETSEDKH
ncbi:response regulator [Crocosphaera sp. XPORK-15E]|uniref:hybrid sensor histidine kinase/response regulator n=1 Tax=Crocosphaera sp. XPORK-15E TaxID=3110247 RepID=UPI002B1EE3D0|nr:response regulator [Crocosphaera sp. XPORK-15E]MEA5533367.1 response regulator [Crocosphaera sp. XPORK-15E]